MFKIDTLKFRKNSDEMNQWIRLFKRENQLVRLRGGTGAYAQCFESKLDPNVVFKIGDPKDDPYWIYVEHLSQTRATNPVLPKIYHAIRLTDRSEIDQYIVVMERLRPANRQEKQALDRLWKHLDFYMDGQMIPTYGVTIDPNIARALKFVNEARKSRRGNHWFDLHDGNWMFRKNQVVLIDPIG